MLTQRSVVYHGLFGSGFFQKLYAAQPSVAPMIFTSLPYHIFVTVPLLVISSHFIFMVPVALASLFASVGLCVIASLQADLPKKKRRAWSRPLVALLFFLQPIVRGWARYKWAWSERAPPHYAAPGAAPLDPKSALPKIVSYWSDGAVDRYTFLKQILMRLQAAQWQTKLDTGYNAYDVEIVGSNWACLRLTTVSEELDQGRRIFRCRLTSRWTFRAQAALWLSTAGVLGVIGILARVEPWLWMLPAALPVLSLFLDAEKRRIHLLLTVLLDQAASELRLVKLPDQVPLHPSGAMHQGTHHSETHEPGHKREIQSVKTS